MKRILFIAILVTFSGFAQNYDVTWGPIIKTKSGMGAKYQVNANSFYASTFGKKRYSGMSYYDNLNLISTTFYKPVVLQKPTAYEGTFEFDDKILVFTSQDNDERTTKTLYVHEFKKSALPIDIEGEKVVSFDFDKQNKKRSGYTLLVSPNKQKICVSYFSSMRRAKDKDKGIYGYFILNADLTIQSEGSFADILEEKGESIDRYTLSNEGELFMITKVNKQDEPVSMKFYKITGDDIKVLDVNLQGNFVSNLNVTIDKKDNFVISGFYGKPYIKGVSKGTGVKGVFFVIMDPQTEEILNSGFNEFSDKFIMEGLTERQKQKTEKRKEKKGIDPSLHNFQIRHFERTDDGGSFGLAEEYFVVVTTYTDPKTGRTTTTYHYYYNDLIAFKLNKEGGMEWQKKIQKYQHSTNDGGYFSSFTMKQHGDHAYILFNDNINNYDPVTKKFLEKEIPQPMQLSAKRNVIAFVDIDLSSGEVERSIFSGLKELKTRLVPRICHPDEKEPSILLYTFSGKTQKIGRITFD